MHLITMLQRTADGALVADRNGKVPLWNRAAEHLLGYRTDEVIGRLCHEVICGKTLSGHPLCCASCPIRKRIAFGKAVGNFDMQTRIKTGRVIWLNVSSLPVPSRKKDRFLVAHLFRDITIHATVSRLVQELHVAASASIHFFA
ncbi:MAG: hypothetical protein AMXMBFR67_23460 [Nitrospira sp.]